MKHTGAHLSNLRSFEFTQPGARVPPGGSLDTAATQAARSGIDQTIVGHIRWGWDVLAEAGPSSADEARVALVTGAGGGLGRACVAALLAAGMRVVATDLSTDLLEPLGGLAADPAGLSL